MARKLHLSWQTIVLSIAVNFVFGLELLSSLILQFELETVPFIQGGAILSGLDTYYNVLSKHLPSLKTKLTDVPSRPSQRNLRRSMEFYVQKL